MSQSSKAADTHHAGGASSDLDVTGLVRMGVDLATPNREVELRFEDERSGCERVFLYSDTAGRYEEISPIDTRQRRPKLSVRRAADVVRWCRTFGDDTEGEIVAGLADIEARTPRAAAPHESRDVCRRPFYSRFLPGQATSLVTAGTPHRIDHRELLSWLDLVGEGLYDRAVWEHALRTIKASAGMVTEIHNVGGAINLSVSAENKIQGGVDGSAQIPKTIETEIPFGDPEFTILVRWRLQAEVDDGQVRFVLRHDPSDRAVESLLEWATGHIQDGLDEAEIGAHWTVYQGA